MQEQTLNRKLILASTSPYRKILLERLRIPFDIFSPSIDESPQPGEKASNLVSRLAADKARAAALRFPSSLVIGSDQLAVYNEEIVGKPGNAANAIEQLQTFSGQTVHFLTAISVFCNDTAFHYEQTVVTDVRFRELSIEEIRRYVEIDMPIDCAGSFKSEAAGISLLQSMTSKDPTAIIGLPLITVSEALRQAGLLVP